MEQKELTKIIWEKVNTKNVDGVDKDLWFGHHEKGKLKSFGIYLIVVNGNIENWFMHKEFRRSGMNNAYIKTMIQSFNEMINENK